MNRLIGLNYNDQVLTMVKIEDTKQLIDALRNKYDDNGFSYAFLEQVSDGTGYKCNRWADALAVQLWESR